MNESLKETLVKQGYRFAGNHSVVKTCRWTRKSLSQGKVCYKEKWYPPVKSHRCMQMSPSPFCNHNCLFCWRMHSGDRGFSWKETFDDRVPKGNNYTLRIIFGYIELDASSPTENTLQVGEDAYINVLIRRPDAPNYVYIIFALLILGIIALIVASVVSWIREKRSK